MQLIATVKQSSIPLSKPCTEADHLLDCIQAHIKQLPEQENDDENALGFAGDPPGRVIIKEGEDPWEVWDPILNGILQCPREDIKALVRHSRKGIESLYKVFSHLIKTLHVPASLVEGKAEHLIAAIDDV